ncbi:TolC family protein [Cytophagales bacterium LB-30]|uniref:TolC family protein n=1 Tax=Shiella aurantiaca TaxID=3058365 RepID=A0ABT8F3C9_9BACT|nr:TolC family protein [Shiella aurantiaca]MDN4164888.1 TolC family protein [Shiella aurantiaca]
MRSKVILLCTLFWLLATEGAMAQQSAGTSAPMTVEECIDYALENSLTLQNARLDEQIANARVKETRGIGLPQIDGSVQVTHNQQLARFFSVYQTAQAFGGVNEQGEPNINIPGVAPTDVVASQNFFQLKSAGQAGLSINQIIFNGSYIVGLKAANAYRELSRRSAEQSSEQTIENVTKAYYSVLINQERLKLFDNNIARVDSLLRTTEALRQNGFAENIDVDRTRVALNNLMTERDKFVQLQDLSMALLKFQMNYPMEEPLSLQPVDFNTLQIASTIDSLVSDWDYSQRADFRLLTTQKNLQELDVKNNYAASMPSLVAFANLGLSTQSPDVAGIFTTNTNINDNGNIGPDKWYGSSLFGVSLQIPLFSGLQRNYKVQQAKLNLQKVENGLQQTQSAIDLEIEQSRIMYANVVKTLASQKQNTELAQNILTVTEAKYKQGLASNQEVITAESDLREAQINYYNSLLDALMARVDLLKSYGLLSEYTN